MPAPPQRSSSIGDNAGYAESVATNPCSRLVVATLCILNLCLAPAGIFAADRADMGVTVNPIALITIDDDARNLHYPSSLFFDPLEQEIYLINGGTSKVVVYGSDFFPLVSIGTGRGVDAPQGVFVAENGTVYICQSGSRLNPSNRVTILNAAFFPIQEIVLNDIPELADFKPSQVVVSREGLIYLAGTASRGVVVLDKNGTFLRRLEPMDLIHDQEAIAVAAWKRAEEENMAGAQEPEPQISAAADIPEEFRPKKKGGAKDSTGPGLGPVRVRKVVTDSEGHLYLISAETSKIYVYNAEETLLFSFGIKGGTAGKLSQPYSLAIDEKNKLLYVVDYMRHSILTFDFRGNFIFEFGGQGAAPGWFNFPVDIAVNRHGQLIVADLFNKRLQVLEVSYELPSHRRKEGATAEDGEGVGATGNASPPEGQSLPAATGTAESSSSPSPEKAADDAKNPFIERGAPMPAANEADTAAPAEGAKQPSAPATQ